MGSNFDIKINYTIFLDIVKNKKNGILKVQSLDLQRMNTKYKVLDAS